MNENLKEKIKQLRKEKLTFREIGERLGISKQRASVLFQATGGKQTWGKWEKFADAWKKEIGAGVTYEEVAKKYKVPTSTIFYHVKKEVFQFDFTCEKCGKVTFGLANVKGQWVSWNCPMCDYNFREKREKFFKEFKEI